MPAGDGGGGFRPRCGQPMQQQGGDAAGLGGQLQPPASRQAEPPDLAQDDGGDAAAQPLFHRPQKIGFAGRMDESQLAGLESKGNEAGAIQIAHIENGTRTQAPQHAAGPTRQPGCQRCGETRRAYGAESFVDILGGEFSSAAQPSEGSRICWLYFVDEWVNTLSNKYNHTRR